MQIKIPEYDQSLLDPQQEPDFNLNSTGFSSDTMHTHSLPTLLKADESNSNFQEKKKRVLSLQGFGIVSKFSRVLESKES